MDYAAAHPWQDMPMQVNSDGLIWTDAGSAAMTWWGNEGQQGVLAPRRAGKITFAHFKPGDGKTVGAAREAAIRKFREWMTANKLK